MFGNLFGGGNEGSAKDSTITINCDDLGVCNQQFGGDEVTALFNIAYAAAAIVAIIVIIIGGIRYATSNGDQGGIQAGKNTIMYAVVGLIVVIMAAAITNFVINTTAGDGGGGAGNGAGTQVQQEEGAPVTQ